MARKVADIEITPAQIKQASKEEIAKGLALLEKERIRKERIQSGELKSQKWSELTDEQKRKRLDASKRRNAKLVLMYHKAIEAGIEEPSDEEIDAHIAANG